MRDYVFTSESVGEGHPDKVCDQISDAILDACLEQDPNSRVACETATKSNHITLLGEITTHANINYEQIVRNTLQRIGYDDEEKGINYKNCTIDIRIEQQSPDINQGVDQEDGDIGAGDQGLMFGFATDETEELMPLSLALSHKLVHETARLRHENILPYLRPDAKSQVSIQYKNGIPNHITAVVLSTQHDEHISIEQLRQDITEHVIKKIIPEHLLDQTTNIYINPTGRFVIGGPKGDAGLTGRKIIVDTYGGHGAHGGGAFSGKDYTKVDRSAAYLARYIAKNIVASKLATKCLVQLSYAIGIAKPTSIYVQTYNTAIIDEEILEKAIEKIFPMTPKQIIEHFNLTQPIYEKTACYGHFGRTDIDLPWEKTDKVETLLELFPSITQKQ